MIGVDFSVPKAKFSMEMIWPDVRAVCDATFKADSPMYRTVMTDTTLELRFAVITKSKTFITGSVMITRQRK